MGFTDPGGASASSTGVWQSWEPARPAANPDGAQQRQAVIKAPLPLWVAGLAKPAGWMLLSTGSREGSPQHQIYTEAVDQLSAASDLERRSTEGSRASPSFFWAGSARLGGANPWEGCQQGPHSSWRGCTQRRGFLTCYTHFSLWQSCTLVFLLPHAPKYTDWPHIPGKGRNPAPEAGAKQLTE